MTEKAVAEEPARDWSRTYIAVIVVEVVVLLSLWWLQQAFKV